MPTGSYRLLDADGNLVARESFRCAPGPAGWRYVAQRTPASPSARVEHVDVSVDAAWRPVRILASSGEHTLALLVRGGRLLGELDGEGFELPWDAEEMTVEVATPAMDAVAANRIGADARELRALGVAPGTLAVEELGVVRYEPLAAEEVATTAGTFAARAYRATGAGGRERRFSVARDVALLGEGYELDTPYDPGGRGPVPRS